jgi:hypothetical protein
MDHRKQAMILDGAADLYSLIREVLAMSSSDQRLPLLDMATERYLKEVLALEDRDRPALRLVERNGGGRDVLDRQFPNTTSTQ